MRPRRAEKIIPASPQTFMTETSRLQLLVRQVLSTCGSGPMLHVNSGNGELVARLLSRSVDAYGVAEGEAALSDLLPDRLFSSINDLPQGKQFDAVIYTGSLREKSRAKKSALVEQLTGLAHRYIFVLPEDWEGNREKWLGSFAVAGFRLSPVHLPKYQRLGDPLTLERDPNGGEQAYSEIDVEVYATAARYVRPNETVFCAAGPGAAYILAENSRCTSVVTSVQDEEAAELAKNRFDNPTLQFVAVDATTWLKDHRVDVVVTDEKSVQPSDCEGAIRPGGRLVVVAPAGTPSDTVYEGKESPFLHEAVHEFCEQTVHVKMRNPLHGASVPYEETVYPYTTPPAHLLHFASEYRNPWLLRSMIEFHFRSDNRFLLRTLAEETYREVENTGVPDEAASLAVIGYQLLGKESPSAAELDEVLQKLSKYQEQAPETPHGVRWRISGRFLQALLLRRLGRLGEAQAAFTEVAGMDPLPFSPTLGTKTVDAAYNAGELAFCSGDVAKAREMWLIGITAAQRLLAVDWTEFIGRPENPLPFPLVVATEFLDSATKCVRALILSHGPIPCPRYAPLVEMSQCMQQWIKDRDEWIHERDGIIEDLAAITHTQERLIHDRDAWIEERDAWIVEREQWILDRDAMIADRDSWIADREQWLAERDEVIALQQQWISDRDAWIADRDRLIQDRDVWVADRDNWIAERDVIIAQQAEELNDVKARLAKQKADSDLQTTVLVRLLRQSFLPKLFTKARREYVLAEALSTLPEEVRAALDVEVAERQKRSFMRRAASAVKRRITRR